MKKILLLLLLINATLVHSQSMVITNASNSQTVVPNVVYTISTAPTLTYATLFNVTNTGSSTHTYVAYRYEVVSSTSGGASSFCYAGGCYGPPAYISALQTLTVGQSASDITGSYQLLSIDYEEGNASSYSLVKYSIKSVDTPSDSITFYMRYNQPNGLQELNPNTRHLNIWPNPATEHIAIQMDDQKEINGEVTILNLLGQPIKNINVSNASIISLNVKDVPRGIYFVRIKTQNFILSRRVCIN